MVHVGGQPVEIRSWAYRGHTNYLAVLPGKVRCHERHEDDYEHVPREFPLMSGWAQHTRRGADLRPAKAGPDGPNLKRLHLVEPLQPLTAGSVLLSSANLVIAMRVTPAERLRSGCRPVPGVRPPLPARRLDRKDPSFPGAVGRVEHRLIAAVGLRRQAGTFDP
jgi:hypothetical protein